MSCFVKLNVLEFLSAVTACEDRALKYAGFRLYKDGGWAFVWQDGDKILSWALVMPNDNAFVLERIYTPEHLRRQGYASALVRELQKDGTKITCSVKQDVPQAEAANALLRKRGFRFRKSMYSFTLSCEAFKDWDKTPDGQRISVCAQYFLKKDFRIISFADATTEQLDYVKNAGKNDFQSTIDPAQWFQRGVEFYEKGCFILLKNEVPVAFALISCPGQNFCVLRLIATAKKFIGRGYAVVLYCALMGLAKREDFQGRVLKYGIHVNNTPALKMQEKFLGAYSPHKALLNFYKWEKNKDE